MVPDWRRATWLVHALRLLRFSSHWIVSVISKKNKTFWFLRLRLRRPYDCAYVYDFCFSPGFNVAYDYDLIVITITTLVRGVARIFQRGRGHTGSNNIVIAFSPRNIVGCLLKKRAYKGGSRAPQDPPILATPLLVWISLFPNTT